MIFRSTFFPYYGKSNKRYRHKVLIGVGCNVGNCVRRFKKLFLYLNSLKFIKIVQTSILYKNPPFGYLEQEDFINTLIVIETDLAPIQLLHFLLRTEKKFRRKRSFKNAPRTLDLDIILFDNLKIEKEKLTIPHPYFKERDSVLVPFSFLK